MFSTQYNVEAFSILFFWIYDVMPCLFGCLQDTTPLCLFQSLFCNLMSDRYWNNVCITITPIFIFRVAIDVTFVVWASS